GVRAMISSSRPINFWRASSTSFSLATMKRRSSSAGRRGARFFGVGSRARGTSGSAVCGFSSARAPSAALNESSNAEATMERIMVSPLLFASGADLILVVTQLITPELPLERPIQRTGGHHGVPCDLAPGHGVGWNLLLAQELLLEAVLLRVLDLEEDQVGLLE